MYDLNTVHLNNLGQKVYLFDINISYPQKLHALHNGYLLEPKNNAIKKNMSNTWQQVYPKVA